MAMSPDDMMKDAAPEQGKQAADPMDLLNQAQDSLSQLADAKGIAPAAKKVIQGVLGQLADLQSEEQGEDESDSGVTTPEAGAAKVQPAL